MKKSQRLNDKAVWRDYSGSSKKISHNLVKEKEKNFSRHIGQFSRSRSDETNFNIFFGLFDCDFLFFSCCMFAYVQLCDTTLESKGHITNKNTSFVTSGIGIGKCKRNPKTQNCIWLKGLPITTIYRLCKQNSVVLGIYLKQSKKN